MCRKFTGNIFVWYLLRKTGTNLFFIGLISNKLRYCYCCWGCWLVWRFSSLGCNSPFILWICLWACFIEIIWWRLACFILVLLSRFTKLRILSCTRTKILLSCGSTRTSSNSCTLKITYEHHLTPSNIQVEFHNNQLYYFYQKTHLMDSVKKWNPSSISFMPLIILGFWIQIGF